MAAMKIGNDYSMAEEIMIFCVSMIKLWYIQCDYEEAYIEPMKINWLLMYISTVFNDDVLTILF